VKDAAMILTYHAVEPGPPPLCVDPQLFARHLDCISASGARVVTVRELADDVRAARALGGAVAITFDDGLASVARNAAPLLHERGLVATVFCVAGRLGAATDWPSRAPGTPVFEVAAADEVAALAAAGWEIGSHGLDHDPLLDGERLRAELVESKRILEQAASTEVASFAFPYGAEAPGIAAALEGAGYEAACSARLALVGPAADAYALPRVDAHYVRRPALLREALAGRAGFYLGARGVGSRLRRLVRHDYAQGAA
jgi:peptidoglycan/xylan/chitin deacetylase (PgdA/CDA1 family)